MKKEDNRLVCACGNKKKSIVEFIVYAYWMRTSASFTHVYMWILMLFIYMSASDEPEVPGILKLGRRGANIKAWTFLRLNENQWYTAREISGYLGLPLSTAQLALRRLDGIAPRIHSQDIMVNQRGRREKQYRYQTNLENI